MSSRSEQPGPATVPTAAGHRVAAAVLAGGLARRMGGDKAGTLVAGRPLISYAIESLREAGLEPLVVTKTDRTITTVPGLGKLREVFEPEQPRHPLLGVLTALEQAEGRDVIVIACDMPLLPPAFLTWLAATGPGTVVPRVGGRLQPLAARYASTAGPAIRREIERGGSMIEAIEALDFTVLEERQLRDFGDPTQMFENVNSPEDVRRVERLLGA